MVPACPDRTVKDCQALLSARSGRSLPGNGLGLPIVAAIAELHGGQLRLEDAAPGLRARIVLPRVANVSFPNGNLAETESIEAAGSRMVVSEFTAAETTRWIRLLPRTQWFIVGVLVLGLAGLFAASPFEFARGSSASAEPSPPPVPPGMFRATAAQWAGLNFR